MPRRVNTEMTSAEIVTEFCLHHHYITNDFQFSELEKRPVFRWPQVSFYNFPVDGIGLALTPQI